MKCTLDDVACQVRKWLRARFLTRCQRKGG